MGALLDCGCMAEHARCPACKAEVRRLAALHRQTIVRKDHPAEAERQRRVELYAARARAGLDIWTGGPKR